MPAVNVPTRARRRFGLRARITLAFSLGALALSAIMATVSYVLVRENTLNQRERAALAQVYGNARVVRDSLKSAEPNVSETLNSLPTPSASRPVLHHHDNWFAVNLAFGERELPLELRHLVLDGQPAQIRYELRGHPQLAVGIPLPSVGASYFEIVSLEGLDDTLDFLALSLLAGAVVATVLGFTLGSWTSRRVLRPLTEVRQAAQALASGRLDTRVEQLADVDLAPLATSFNDMATKLQDRIERDTRFASDISHELRSPLTTLSASVAVLESRRDELPERSRAALDLLSGDVARFQSMVEDLLEISRFDAGAARLDLEPVRIAELVLHAVGMARGNGDFPVDIEADAGGTVVLADKRRLTRVIANLVDNAVKHGGGVTRLAVERCEDGVHLAVEDAGDGVAPEDRERVFERFSRGVSVAGRRGSGDGVGLGLSLVREHVALHGGSVWVEDGIGGVGARFVVALPEAEPAEDEIDAVTVDA